MKSYRKSLAVMLLGGGVVAGMLVGIGAVREYAFVQAEQKVEATREQLSTVNDLSTRLPRSRQGRRAVGGQHRRAQDHQRRASPASV